MWPVYSEDCGYCFISLLGEISEDNNNCQRAAEAKRPRLRGGSIIEPRVYLDVQGEKFSSDPEKR